MTIMTDRHPELFPEEYDFINDSVTDARLRKRGINPMAQSYIDEVNERRYKMGVKAFMPTSASPEHHLATLNDDLFLTSHAFLAQ
ncbi:hypothetical protein [Photobacterium sp. OFAV2-7]|uniref:hypothetical protein n=1 Tax=Photobacterium sp. OFAV2-7 TaxID=2917748 RepID=UPI001EF58498|nr:hypothetical protein [Photobacterium sp. OFAV2-7]MCG7584849.1 hypothetical protein [Photobacterium sp. OFAV2-7]